MLKVAVSGVGGAVGQSILKALGLAQIDLEVYPVDIQELSVGLWRSGNGFTLPRPELPGSLTIWREELVSRGIDALIPGSDHDLLALSEVREEWELAGGPKVLVSDAALVRACNDKALTHEILVAAGLPAPQSLWDATLEQTVKWARNLGYPVVVKPRDGFGSRHVQVIPDEESLRFFFPRTPNPITQEYLQLDGAAEEFTCSVFVDRDGSPVGTFAARRELVGGATARAEVGFWPDVHDLVASIGSALKPVGPLNVQLRRTARGPVPFELNIRCSGTSAVRAYFGYNEPEMLLRHLVLGETLSPPEVTEGYVMRYWNEMFLPGVTGASMSDSLGKVQGVILPWP